MVYDLMNPSRSRFLQRASRRISWYLGKSTLGLELDQSPRTCSGVHRAHTHSLPRHPGWNEPGMTEAPAGPPEYTSLPRAVNALSTRIPRPAR